MRDSTIILVGSEDPQRVQAAADSLAPRLDYRLVAEFCQGAVQQWQPSPSGFYGSRVSRLGQSFLGNLKHAQSLVRALPPGSTVYSTGETWGLPVGLAGALLRRREFRHVVYVHRVFSPRWLRFLQRSQRLLAVDGWICVTQHQANLLRTAAGPHGALVTVVCQGVDSIFFDRAKSSSIKQKPYILALGAEMRDYELFLDAVRNLEIEVIIKASSAWMTRARNTLSFLPANVTMISRHLSYIELRDLYAGAILVVVPLYDTPQAAGITTVLEAMAMQKCVVATKSVGLPDILIHGETGMISESSSQALTEVLMQLLAAPQHRESLAYAGRQVVEQLVTIEHYAQRISDILLSD